MYLSELINVMYKKDTGEETRNITIRQYDLPEKVFYKGDLKFLHEYIKTHMDLHAAHDDRILLDLLHIRGWMVAEMKIDNTWPGEEMMPYYNKAKIISVR